MSSQYLNVIYICHFALVDKFIKKCYDVRIFSCVNDTCIGKSIFYGNMER